MLKWELGNLLVRHENVLKEEQKLPVDVRGSKTSVLKLSIVYSKTRETWDLPRKGIDPTFWKYNLVASFTWSVLHYPRTVIPNWCPCGENWLISDFCYQKRALSNRTVHFFTNFNTSNIIQSLPSYIFIEIIYTLSRIKLSKTNYAKTLLFNTLLLFNVNVSFSKIYHLFTF